MFIPIGIEVLGFLSYLKYGVWSKILVKDAFEFFQIPSVNTSWVGVRNIYEIAINSRLSVALFIAGMLAMYSYITIKEDGR